MNECVDWTYYQENWDIILNRAKDYENDKERLREQARDKYRNFSEEEKKLKWEYEYVRRKEKKTLKEYQKNYCEAKKKSKYNDK